MGCFKDLSDVGHQVHLYMKSSNMAEIFIHDTLKKVHGVNIDCIYPVTNAKEFAFMLELSAMQPLSSDRWLFEINYPKVRNAVKANKDLFKSETSVFSFYTEKYRDYKELKEVLPNINDIYTPIVRRNDMFYLFSGMGLTDKVLDFISASYARDPDLVFELRKQIIGGLEINTARDVVKCIGASSGSVNKFIMMLLSEPPKTTKGMKKVLKTRLQMGKDLCEAYGPASFRNFISASLYDMLQIKMLYMHGVIYNKIYNLPEGFDEKRLSKYGFYLNQIETELSYEELLRLYVYISDESNKRWRSEQDMVRFVYKCYENVEVAS